MEKINFDELNMSEAELFTRMDLDEFESERNEPEVLHR